MVPLHLWGTDGEYYFDVEIEPQIAGFFWCLGFPSFLHVLVSFCAGYINNEEEDWKIRTAGASGTLGNQSPVTQVGQPGMMMMPMQSGGGSMVVGQPVKPVQPVKPAQLARLVLS